MLAEVGREGVACVELVLDDGSLGVGVENDKVGVVAWGDCAFATAEAG